MKKNVLLEVTSILNKSIYQVMLCGCFIAKGYQYLNLRVKLLFIRIKCAQEAKLLTGNKHRHLVLFVAAAACG